MHTLKLNYRIKPNIKICMDRSSYGISGPFHNCSLSDMQSYPEGGEGEEGAMHDDLKNSRERNYVIPSLFTLYFLTSAYSRFEVMG